MNARLIMLDIIGYSNVRITLVFTNVICKIIIGIYCSNLILSWAKLMLFEQAKTP